MKAAHLFLFVGLVLIVAEALHQFDRAPALPLVKADFPVCVMQHPPPLIPQERQIAGIPYNPEIV